MRKAGGDKTSPPSPTKHLFCFFNPILSIHVMNTLSNISESLIIHPQSREILLWIVGQVIALLPVLIVYILILIAKKRLKKKIKWYTPLIDGDLFLFSTTLASFSLSSVIIKKPELLKDPTLLLTFIVLCVVLFLNLLFVYLDSSDKIAEWCKKERHDFLDGKQTAYTSLAFAILTLGLSFLLFYNGAY